jgi:hypothetical protein
MTIENFKVVLLYAGAGILAIWIMEIIIEAIRAVVRHLDGQRWVKQVPYTQLVEETIRYTNNILYEKKITHFPRFIIHYYRHKKYAGQFDGKVIVYLKSNPDIPVLVNTVLHEVMHYIQSKTDKQFKLYGQYTRSYGYRNNPLEIEARAFAEKHCKPCLKYLESKQLIKKQ